MMTLDEMKLAVCEKLPESIEVDKQYNRQHWKLQQGGKPLRWPEILWDTEGLQVCHEAEKLLDDNQWEQYWYALHRITPGRPTCVCHATYEQRLEALCRVWYPKRFHNQNT